MITMAENINLDRYKKFFFQKGFDKMMDTKAVSPAQLNTQNLIKRGRESLSNVENTIADIQKLVADAIEFYPETKEGKQQNKFVKKRKKKIKKIENQLQKDYPTAISRHHLKKSFLNWWSFIPLGLTLLTLFYLGGFNISLWSSALLMIGLGAGVATDIPLAAILKNSYKKHYNKHSLKKSERRVLQNLKNKKNKLENELITNDKQSAMNIVGLNLDSYISSIIGNEENLFFDKEGLLSSEFDFMQSEDKETLSRLVDSLTSSTKEIQEDYKFLNEKVLAVKRTKKSANDKKESKDKQETIKKKQETTKKVKTVNTQSVSSSIEAQSTQNKINSNQKNNTR